MRGTNNKNNTINTASKEAASEAAQTGFLASTTPLGVEAEVKKPGGPWTVTLPMVTPSLNQVRRMHWAQVKRDKATLSWLLVSALNKIPNVPRATGTRRLVIVRHGRKTLDLDNLAGGCKSLIDVIKERGLLLDDSPAHCLLEFHQEVTRKGDPFTEILIEECAS